MIKGIIFDCDGVLTDTEPKFTKGMLDHLQALGIKADSEDLNQLCGMTMRQSCEEVMRRYNIQGINIEVFIEEQQMFDQQYFQDEMMTPMKGLLEFIHYCVQRGMKLGIASSSPYSYVTHLLTLFKIKDFFSIIVTKEHVEKGKPAPDIYLKAIEKMQIPKEELFVVEDSYHGIASAIAAELKVIGFKGSEVHQDTSLATFEVSSYQELMHLMESL